MQVNNDELTCSTLYISSTYAIADSKPTIMKPIQTSYIILSGHSVCLPCELTQQFDVSPIRWMFKETLIENINDNHLDVTLNGSLCIDNAGPHHTGSYVCLAGSDRLEHTVSVIGELPDSLYYSFVSYIALSIYSWHCNPRTNMLHTQSPTYGHHDQYWKWHIICG